MLQAIGYVRRSTDRQDESLEQQRAKLHAAAESRGWKLVAIYEDDAISGSDMNRPGLADLVKRAESDPGVHAVMAWDRNRLARPKDAIDGLMLERKLLATGKRLLYAATNQEADRSFAGTLVGFVENHQNGDYLRKLSRDVTRGMVSCVERGRWAAGAAPFGYDRAFVDRAAPGTKVRCVVRCDVDGSTLVIDPATGATVERIAKGQRYRKQDHEETILVPSDPARVRAVRSIFTDYANGVPMRSIRDRLNNGGFRTNTGGLFSIPTIQVILDNAAYTGRYVYNKRTESKWHRVVNGQSVERSDQGQEQRPESDWIIAEHAWEAIIDDELFQRVKARRKAMSESHSKASGSAVNAGYLLTGLGTCGVCSGKLVGMTSSAGSQGRKRYRHYICGRHHHGDHAACPKRYSINADMIEGHILDLIRTDLAMLRDDPELQRMIAHEFARLTASVGDEREQAQRRLVDLDQRSAKLRDHLLALDPAAAKSMGLYDKAKQLADERQAVEQALASMGPAIKVPTTAEVRERAAATFDRLGDLMANAPLEQRREFIAAYVQSIAADPSRGVVTIRMFSPLFTRESVDPGACPCLSLEIPRPRTSRVWLTGAAEFKRTRYVDSCPRGQA